MRIRAARGEGVVLERRRRRSTTRAMRARDAGGGARWLRRDRAAPRGCRVGELRLAPGVPFALDAGGFDRHTFFCGQSGSGKTYALGVVLEQLLLRDRACGS